MRASVASAWPALCTQYEGRCSWLYLDTLKLPTTGLGYRVVDLPAMLALPWQTKAGDFATQSQIATEWSWINSQKQLAPKGGFAYQDIATLHLGEAEIERQLFETTGRFWGQLLKTLPQLESWPADAQLALMDMAWNLGPNFLGSGWPNFTAAAKAADFATCAEHCMRAVKAPRDYRHVSLFNNAATVARLGLNPEQLWDYAVPAAPVAPAPTAPPEPPKESPVATTKHSAKYGDYVNFRGGNVPPVVAAVLLAIPSSVNLSQGGLSGSVAASANTHNGLGAYDINVKGWSKAKITTLCEELIRSGECAYPRGPRWGSPSFVEHVHVCSNNCYSQLHPEAQAQVRDFKASPRKNGLVGHARYVGPSTPLGTWKDSPYNPANIKAEPGVFYVATDTLIGNSVDRVQKEKKVKGDRISYVKQVRRWGRWNAVTVKETYFAIKDDTQSYLTTTK